MKASARSNYQKREPSLQVQNQCGSQNSPSVTNVSTAGSRDLTQSVTVPTPSVSGASVPTMEVDSDESRRKQSSDTGIQATQTKHIETSPSTAAGRSLEDVYNWRKYGEKHIKGNELSRSYYKCSHLNCLAKKQVLRSNDGQTREITYKGNHDHPQPHSFSQMEIDKPSNGNSQIRNRTKPNTIPEPSPVTASDGEGAVAQSKRSTEGIKDTNDPEFAQRCLKLNKETRSDASARLDHQQGEPSDQAEGQCMSQARGQSVSAKNVTESASSVGQPHSAKIKTEAASPRELDLAVIVPNKQGEPSSHPQGRCESAALGQSPSAKIGSAASSRELDLTVIVPNKQGEPSSQPQGQCESPALGQSPSAKIGSAASSHKLNVSVRVPKPLLCAVTSRAIVPVEVDSNESHHRQAFDSGVPTTPSDHKGPLVAAERLSEDGYNWRKYGQKRIIGSEFPRSYYRCTHPNCQVKKQLERSHDGKITEIIYKGKHDHPKPQPSSRMVVGTILSIQEESDRLRSSNNTKDKSSDGDGTPSCHTMPNGTHELSCVKSDDAVEGEGAQSKEIGNEADCDDDRESKRRCLKSNTETSIASAGSNHQQSEPSVQIQVYMVTPKDDLPVEVNSDARQQQEGSENVPKALESDHKGTNSVIAAERLPEDVYNWRKYGQKQIKGNEFPRSYYRCTYPKCQVKKQLGLSHDGKIIEIIYKGKHDHPKPLPRGAILAIQEDRSDLFSSLNNAEDKLLSEQGQTSRHIKLIDTHEFSVVMASDDGTEVAGAQLNRGNDEVENDDDDPQSKRRKTDGDVLDVTAMSRTNREMRRVVETLSEVDVVDDGYRWHKYGRKMVKGNLNPRNYYRCSNSGCSVKKHVERAAHDPKIVVTTYEGKHDHDMPAVRANIHDTSGLIVDTTVSDGTLRAISEEHETIRLDPGAGISSSPDNRTNEKPQILDMEPIKIEPYIVIPDANNMVEETASLDTPS